MHLRPRDAVGMVVLQKNDGVGQQTYSATQLLAVEVPHVCNGVSVVWNWPLLRQLLMFLER